MEVIDLVDFCRCNGVILDKTLPGIRYSKGEVFCVKCVLIFDSKRLSEPYVCPVCGCRMRSRSHS